MSRTINELNTTDTIVDADKFVIWQNTSQATRAITAADMADYFSLAGGPYQPSDELLTSIAALGPSTTADRMIYTTAQDVAALTTLTAFARTFLDDANQAAGQTTLGYTAADVLAKLITVDGAGSNLDADLLDGVQGSAYATLAGANTFTARQIVDRTAAAAAGNVTIRGGGTGFVRSSLTLETAETVRGAGVFIWDDTVDVEFFFGLRFNHASADGLSILRRTGVTSASTDSATADPAVATEIARFSSTGMIARTAPSTETTGTLTVASANRTIQLTGNPTINNSVFSAGDMITMYAGDTARTITAGTITTMRLGGTATTGSRTLAARGLATLFFVSSSEVVVSGGAVT